MTTPSKLGYNPQYFPMAVNGCISAENLDYTPQVSGHLDDILSIPLYLHIDGYTFH